MNNYMLLYKHKNYYEFIKKIKQNKTTGFIAPRISGKTTFIINNLYERLLKNKITGLVAYISEKESYGVDFIRNIRYMIKNNDDFTIISASKSYISFKSNFDNTDGKRIFFMNRNHNYYKTVLSQAKYFFNKHYPNSRCDVSPEFFDAYIKTLINNTTIYADETLDSYAVELIFNSNIDCEFFLGFQSIKSKEQLNKIIKNMPNNTLYKITQEEIERVNKKKKKIEKVEITYTDGSKEIKE